MIPKSTTQSLLLAPWPYQPTTNPMASITVR